jgi:hypothetical protein
MYVHGPVVQNGCLSGEAYLDISRLILWSVLYSSGLWCQAASQTQRVSLSGLFWPWIPPNYERRIRLMLLFSSVFIPYSLVHSTLCSVPCLGVFYRVWQQSGGNLSEIPLFLRSFFFRLRPQRGVFNVVWVMRRRPWRINNWLCC